LKIFGLLPQFPFHTKPISSEIQKRSGGSQTHTSESEFQFCEAPARFKDDFSDLFLAT